MASVGGIPVDIIRGELGNLKRRLDIWYRPGLNGYGAHDLGASEGEFEIRAIWRNAYVNVLAWAASLELLVGAAPVTIVDDWGAVWNNCMITEVKRIAIKREINGYINGARGELAISIVRT